MSDGVLDAASVHNLATFLECLVLADEIRVAPTLSWQPDRTDQLFPEWRVYPNKRRGLV